MVVKVYISRTSADKEIKYRQQRILQILQSKNIYHETVDVSEIDNHAQKDFMQKNAVHLGATIVEPNPLYALPPQIFNDDSYCGDFTHLEMANEISELDKFLKLVPDEPEVHTSTAEMVVGEKEEEGEVEEE